MKTKLKTGILLTATDPCVMEGGYGEALIVGKEYQIKKVVGDEFYIASEVDGAHLFDESDIEMFKELKLNRIDELEEIKRLEAQL